MYKKDLFKKHVTFKEPGENKQKMASSRSLETKPKQRKSTATSSRDSDDTSKRRDHRYNKFAPRYEPTPSNTRLSAGREENGRWLNCKGTYGSHMMTDFTCFRLR